MDFEEFKTLVQKTRTTRRFKKDIQIDTKELEEIINLVRVSPSPKNMQPLKYITITNKEFSNKISETCTWASHLENWTQSEDERPSAYIIILNDTSIDGFPMIDCGTSLNSIMLGLKTKGYASAPLASIDKALIKKLFKLEKHLEPMIGIAIGVEDEVINLVELKEDVNYYRNEKDEHCVPKRDLEDILIGKF